jgi:hypothetical protein
MHRLFATSPGNITTQFPHPEHRDMANRAPPVAFLALAHRSSVQSTTPYSVAALVAGNATTIDKLRRNGLFR